MRRYVTQLLLTGISLLLAAYMLGPILWMTISSVQLDRDLFTVPPNWIPRNPTLDNYIYILTGVKPPSYSEAGMGGRANSEALNLLPALRNSSIVAVAVTAGNLVISSLAAYSFTRLRFRGREALYGIILASRLLPGVAVAIPSFVIMRRLGLLDTKLALIVLYLALTVPFTTWFLSKYFEMIPPEMEEAALIDGCTRFQALLRVVVPIATPGLTAAGAFAFMGSYSEFLFALFLTKTMASKTIPVVLTATAINFDVSFALASAALVLAMVPPILFALIFRDYITRGLAFR